MFFPVSVLWTIHQFASRPLIHICIYDVSELVSLLNSSTILCWHFLNTLGDTQFGAFIFYNISGDSPMLLRQSTALRTCIVLICVLEPERAYRVLAMRRRYADWIWWLCSWHHYIQRHTIQLHFRHARNWTHTHAYTYRAHISHAQVRNFWRLYCAARARNVKC